MDEPWYSTAKEKLQPSHRMVWAERDLKDHPGCPFCSSYRREFIRENIQLLIISDGFSFQPRPCHLAGNAEKADTPRKRKKKSEFWDGKKYSPE